MELSFLAPTGELDELLSHRGRLGLGMRLVRENLDFGLVEFFVRFGQKMTPNIGIMLKWPQFVPFNSTK